MPDDDAPWSLVMPVKRLEVAKSRLGTPYDAQRSALALAFALDTAEAALACPQVASVLVVTDDVEVARAVQTVGAKVVHDVPDSGLNAAIRFGVEVTATRADPVRVGPVAVLTADLPALRPEDLGAALASSAEASFVRDSDGSGTTLLMARRPALLDPMFGMNSAAAHATWAKEVVAAASVRRDVDTAAHLDTAITLGLGPATTAMLQDPRPAARRARRIAAVTTG